MSERPSSSSSAFDRIGVIDLGSNSLRLVIFERHGSALFPLLNEKVMCGLARGLSITGRLNRDGVALALVNLARFVALARSIGVDHLAVLATAAVRDAADGQAFANRAAQACDVPVAVIDGVEEARLSATGVLAGIPEADGIVGDLGGGSVELVRVEPPGLEGAESGERIGRGVSLPLGPLRVAEFGDSPRKVSEEVERIFATTPLARAGRGKSLYLVGGAARAIARLHMEHSHYPLHIVHGYSIPRAEAEAFFDIISRLSRKSLERITTISRKRLEIVPLAALILRRLIAVMAPRQIIFSAYGLREGYASTVAPQSESSADPLIAACVAISRRQSRFATDGERLCEWTAGLFPALSEPTCRLHLAACWLSDIAWIEHPDYRAQEAFTRSLRLPFAAATHADRVFIASVLHSRYGGDPSDPIREPTAPLLDPAAAADVRILGSALRLAYALTGGRIDLLSKTWLGREHGRLILEVPAGDDLFAGETMQRRLDSVARALGAVADVRRREVRRLAGD
jgi:exopolyphosphatase / guanosine-5'-triphosphate,3'-diphosphate pyrophosphatase